MWHKLLIFFLANFLLYGSSIEQIWLDAVEQTSLGKKEFKLGNYQAASVLFTQASDKFKQVRSND
ncbi:MAG: hypothetical protein ACRC37_07320, partial [Lentisphaeria bacterium]